MKPDDDPLRELSEAFGALPAPPPTRELGDEDAATRRAVAWMAAALAAQQPASDGLAALQARRAAPLRRWAWRPLAAAALLLVLLGGPILLAVRASRARPAAGPPTLAIAPPGPVTAPPTAPVAAPPPTAPVAPAPPRPVLVAVAEHRLEARSGPVHLLLVLDQPPPSPEESR